MFDRSDVEAMRKPLELCCRRPDARANPPEIDLPNKWLPFLVQHPVLMSNFTDEGAWEFIADCLRGSVPIRYKPPTAKFPDHAYEMVAAPPEGGPEIYMKIALPLVGKKLLGVSFHHGRP